jgi:hypothetical protein
VSLFRAMAYETRKPNGLVIMVSPIHTIHDFPALCATIPSVTKSDHPPSNRSTIPAVAIHQKRSSSSGDANGKSRIQPATKVQNEYVSARIDLIVQGDGRD